MTPKLHIVSHGLTFWKNELPADFAGSRLPGGRVFTATGDFGSICMQIYSGRNFSFGYIVASSRQQFSIRVQPHHGGICMFGSLLEDASFFINGMKVVQKERQWSLFRGIPEMKMDVEAGSFPRLFSVWCSDRFCGELLCYFPELYTAIERTSAGNMVPDSIIHMDHTAAELVQQVLRCQYPSQWRIPFYRYRAADILFKYLADKSLFNPLDAPYTPEECDKVYTAERIITEDISAHYIIPELAKKAGMNDQRFKTVFKMVFGMGPYEYLREKRLQKAIELLDRGEMVKYAAIETGWRPEDLINAYKARFGTTPGKRKR
ncbi:MAG: helix-turn-helix transcriptional regulator [Chitinophagaceae bacterium]|nr:helix-turn-helix transcriptional regulator [Chitinophagaceae bacterium]MCW5925574.1 helix-turn-helix transcriptional regulator [Chitinophagaceae bacterium]